MDYKKTAISAAITSVLSVTMAAPAQAVIIDMEFDGLVTVLDTLGIAIHNTSEPYYSDPTWNHGARMPVTGTLSLDTVSGAGTGTISPFEFLEGGPATASDLVLQAVGGGLMIANMNYNWNGSDSTVNVVLDASGLIFGLSSGVPPVGTVIDSTACVNYGLPCATPASDAIDKGTISIGPIPIATSSINVAGDTGFGVTLGQLSLGTDDGIGGSPLSNGAFEGLNANFDITSVEVVSTVPVPAAVWLFGSGLIGLVGFARRKRK